MHITRAFPGLKTVMLKFCLISVLLLSGACHQEVDLPEFYEVTFSNHYFEALDSIEIENQKVENIDMGENITFYNIHAGNNNINIITQSGLKLNTACSLTGSNPVVRITITETGKLILD